MKDVREQLWAARRFPLTGALVVTILTALLLLEADYFVDALRMGFILGAVSITYHIIVVCWLYTMRYRQFRLGRRRMIPPIAIYTAAASQLVVLGGISYGAISKLGQPGLWMPYAFFFVGMLAGHAYLVPLLAHQRAHSLDPLQKAARARIHAEAVGSRHI